MPRTLMMATTLSILVTTTPITARAQSPHQDEAAIRAIAESLSNAYGKTGHRARDAYAPQSIFVSGAYAKPIVGRDTKAERLPSARGERKNEESRETIRRLNVSKSGDMAWEFTDFRLSWDDSATGKRVGFPGSMLRVWEKIDGKWMIAAEFRRPNEDE